jgi:hypothetical protein
MVIVGGWREIILRVALGSIVEKEVDLLEINIW